MLAGVVTDHLGHWIEAQPCDTQTAARARALGAIG
jgi:hypothetical protein